MRGINSGHHKLQEFVAPGSQFQFGLSFLTEPPTEKLNVETLYGEPQHRLESFKNLQIMLIWVDKMEACQNCRTSRCKY